MGTTCLSEHRAEFTRLTFIILTSNLRLHLVDSCSINVELRRFNPLDVFRIVWETCLR